jgi:hypothetical protein
MVKGGEDTSLRDLLKYTLMDLILKQVLMTVDVERQARPGDPVRVYKYVSIGKNFRRHRCMPHERVFVSVFQDTGEMRMLFRNLVKIGYQNSGSKRYYFPHLTTNVNLSDVFYKSFFQRLLGGFSYTKNGIKLQEELGREITALEKTLPGILANDRARGIEMLRAIGGNVFLLKGIDFSIAKEFDDEFFEEATPPKKDSGCSSGCWTVFDSYPDSDSSDTGSGCGGDGDSGCSSSGCSGCGGCGGD